MQISSLEGWKLAYDNGACPAELLEQQRLACSDNDPAWISIATQAQLLQQISNLKALEKTCGREHLALYGIPFAVKDNIDVAGFRTTAACEAFAYTAGTDAYVVKQLRDAGAIVLGKTNLDQFATGLVGTRSPYGVVPNVFDPELISGGSSSGSASVVARGLVPFALSTDTAGSGRVPAGFNQIVGLKPTPGAVSCTGLVRACRTLDCIGVLATSVVDSATVLSIIEGTDGVDTYGSARPITGPHKPLHTLRIATPADRKLSSGYEAAFCNYVTQLREQTSQVADISFQTLDAVANLLYQGPWIAERVVGAQDIYEQHPERLLPVIRSVLDVAGKFSAADTFAAQYRLQDLKKEANRIWEDWDVLCVPTAPHHPGIAQVQADPICVNSEMGVYTNFVNLLGWSAISIPASVLQDRLPFGITLIAPGWHEPHLVRWAQQLEKKTDLPAGVTGLRASTSSHPLPLWHTPIQGNTIKLAVVGAHLRGMPLNHELQACGARFLKEARTAADYRLFALHGTVPSKPGLARADSGSAIELEVWEVPLANFGYFVAGIPSPLGIGSIALADGEMVKGFICEGHALTQATDITDFGGWRAYCNTQSTAAIHAFNNRKLESTPTN